MAYNVFDYIGFSPHEAQETVRVKLQTQVVGLYAELAGAVDISTVIYGASLFAIIRL